MTKMPRLLSLGHICLLFEAQLNNNIDKQLYCKACSAKCKYLFLSQEVLVFVEATGNYLTVKIILRAKYMYYHQSFFYIN